MHGRGLCNLAMQRSPLCHSWNSKGHDVADDTPDFWGCLFCGSFQGVLCINRGRPLRWHGVAGQQDKKISWMNRLFFSTYIKPNAQAIGGVRGWGVFSCSVISLIS